MTYEIHYLNYKISTHGVESCAWGFLRKSSLGAHKTYEGYKMITMSPTIGKLAEALSKAQAEIQHAAKDKDNPFFKSSYADLASVWDACREPLTKYGLSVCQTYENENGKVTLVTMLLHTSGEYIPSYLPVSPVKNDPQGLASAMTYMKRAALSAIAGVAPAEKPLKEDVVDDDDDGEAASGRYVSPPPKAIVAVKGSVVVAPKPPLDPAIRNVIVKIMTLKNALAISDDDFRQTLHREFKQETMKGLTLDQLTKFRDYLDPTHTPEIPLGDIDQEWLREASGPL